MSVCETPRLKVFRDMAMLLSAQGPAVSGDNNIMWGGRYSILFCLFEESSLLIDDIEVVCTPCMNLCHDSYILRLAARAYSARYAVALCQSVRLFTTRKCYMYVKAEP